MKLKFFNFVYDFNFVWLIAGGGGGGVEKFTKNIPSSSLTFMIPLIDIVSG